MIPLLLRPFIETLIDEWADKESLKIVCSTIFERLCREYPVFKEAADRNPFGPADVILASIENPEEQREMKKVVTEAFANKKLIKAQEKVARVLTDILEE